MSRIPFTEEIALCSYLFNQSYDAYLFIELSPRCSDQDFQIIVQY